MKQPTAKHDLRLLGNPGNHLAADPLLEVSARLENCARMLDLEAWVLLRLRQFEQETTLHAVFPSASMAPTPRSAGGWPARPPECAEDVAYPLTAFWVRHSTACGPAIVPLSISADAFSNCVRAKAMRMTWTVALYGLDAGGGAGAIILDPSQLTERDLHQAVHRIGQSLATLEGPHPPPLADAGWRGSGIPCASRLPQLAEIGPTIIPDGLNPVEMEWLNAAFRAAGNYHTHISGRPSVSMGKRSDNDEPVSPGILRAPHLLPSADAGSPIAFGLTELIRCSAGHLRDLRVAVQGFDPVCRSLAYRLHRSGARVVAVADASAGVRDPLGLDPAALSSYARENEVLVGYPAAETILNAELLETDCDILVLAAGAHQVSSHNASRIRARAILEAAPHAISSAAEAELSAAGKIVVSDLVCDGISALYYASEIERGARAVRAEPWLRRRVRNTWSEIENVAAKRQAPLYQAADLLAVERVAEVVRAGGI
jgi:glutamate dehydrogenase (NAD(P)+)